MSLIRELLSKDERFRLFRQNNAGPGVARNLGLDLCKGEYFTFVDADDLVHPEMLERLLLLSQSHGADLVVCKYARFQSDAEFHRVVCEADLSDKEVELERAPLLEKTVNWRKFRVHPVGKLYERARHGNLRFPALWGSEDALASFDAYRAARLACFSDWCLYGYRIVDGGLTRSVHRYRNYIAGDCEVAVHAESLGREEGLSEFVRGEMVRPYVMRVFALLNDMAMDKRISRDGKRDLIDLANRGLQQVGRAVAGKYAVVPLVHYIPYCAVRLRALWMLRLWQRLRVPGSGISRRIRAMIKRKNEPGSFV